MVHGRFTLSGRLTQVVPVHSFRMPSKEVDGLDDAEDEAEEDAEEDADDEGELDTEEDTELDVELDAELEAELETDDEADVDAEESPIPISSTRFVTPAAASAERKSNLVAEVPAAGMLINDVYEPPFTRTRYWSVE